MNGIDRFIISLFLIFSTHLFIHASTLSAGDIAIISMNADGQDDFTFLLLSDISGTTEIHFTDQGWDAGTNDWGTANEGTVTWTFTGNLSLGTEISISGPQSGTATASSGTASVSGSFNISGGGDQLIAYQGTVGSPTFLYAFNHRAACWFSCSVGTSSLNSNLPPGLTEGMTALTTDPTHADNWQYNCAVVSGTREEILTAIADVSNYINNNSTVYGAPGCNILLPVELVSFKATLDLNNLILLSWETSSETNNRGFEVERRSDNSRWENIGFVEGAYNSNHLQTYTFVDREPFRENYYRIKQVDEDGTYEYSKIIHIPISINESNISFFPNPASQQVTVSNVSGTITLYNISGHPLGVYNIQGLSTIIDISLLDKGFYYFVLTTELGENKTWQFIKN